MPPDLVLQSTLIGSNYPCLELIFMVPKVFEPLKFDCSAVLANAIPVHSSILSSKLLYCLVLRFHLLCSVVSSLLNQTTLRCGKTTSMGNVVKPPQFPHFLDQGHEFFLLFFCLDLSVNIFISDMVHVRDVQ